MTEAAITILGLGPGNIEDLTVQACVILTQAAQTQQTVYFRTTIHPTVDALQRELPQLQLASFDSLYEESNDWSTLYARIAEEVCELAARQAVVYAVPGHPLIGESSVQLVLQQAKERGLRVAVVAGLSFIEPVCTLLELDPFDAGLQIIDATELAALAPDEVAGRIVPTRPLLVVQVYNRRLASAVKLSLSECYPDEWAVTLVRAAGIQLDGNESSEMTSHMPLYDLDRNNFANHLSTLYVPAVDPLTAVRVPETLRYITMRLRRDPDGCPWDREQTHQSLARYALEEAYEVVEAIEEHNMEHLSEELGDLLLQVYLHAEVARQAGEFSLGDVCEHINAKLIRRHPHVFSTVEVSNAGQVVQNWEAIKKQEKEKAGIAPKESVLDGVPLASPALTVAQEYQKKAVKVGFSYNTVEWVYGKLEEELQELQRANESEHVFEEVGDVLFQATMIADAHHINAETALRAANRKFRQRFLAMEKMIREQGRELSSYSTKEWGELWNKAKEEHH